MFTRCTKRYVERRMTVNLVFWCCLISGFGVRGFRSPEDQVVVAGGQMRLNCSNLTATVAWSSPSGSYLSQARVVLDNRFNLTLTDGFDLVANNVNASFCGTYTCESQVYNYKATANIVVFDRLPLCRGIGNDSYAEVNCSVIFCGNTSSLLLRLENENGQGLSPTIGNSTFITWSGYYNKSLSCSAAPGIKSSCDITWASTTNSSPSTATVNPTTSTASDSMTSGTMNPSSVTATVSSTNPSASGSVAPSTTNPSPVTATGSSINPSASDSATQSTMSAESLTTMTPPIISSSMVAVAVAVPLAVAVVAIAIAAITYALLSNSAPAAAAAASASGANVGAARKPFAEVGFYSRKNLTEASFEPAYRPYSNYRNPMGYRNSVFNQNSGARYVSRYPVNNGGGDLYAARAFNQ